MRANGGVDHAIVGGSGGIRADVGATVFLSDPSSYEGGDLVIDTGYGEELYKGRAGAVVVRPASARHRIARVTRGVRWTAELWAQSLVRNPAQREILHDIGCSLRSMELLGMDGSDGGAAVDRLRACHRNLLRLWSDP
ncbi:hypothetical protein [Sorangium sp. So ce1335]|uniref:hypothetical protein n=1 Tax=Sorangium sp. So ce1335 TaxID=3133335 RepID=UPI003F6221F6